MKLLPLGPPYGPGSMGKGELFCVGAFAQDQLPALNGGSSHHAAARR
jgi:hypothetical protein